MDWILYVFKRGNKHYLVPADCWDDAWELLAKRQSMSIERCKKEYKDIKCMNGNSVILKV